MGVAVEKVDKDASSGSGLAENGSTDGVWNTGSGRVGTKIGDRATLTVFVDANPKVQCGTL